MNLTIELREERIDKSTGKIAAGLSVFKDIKSLKLESVPYGTNKYKLEIVMFLGDKYNKQLITIDNMERVTASGIAGIIYNGAYNEEMIATSMDTDKEPSRVASPLFEYPESYIKPDHFVSGFRKQKETILKRKIRISNSIKEVEIDVNYEHTYTEKETRWYNSGDFKFGKLNQVEENNPGADYGEIWKQLDDTKYKRFMAILNASNKWKGDLEAIKHNTKLSCDKIWKVDISKEDQVQCAVDDVVIDPRYIMEIYGGLNGHGDWESYLDGLRAYIKCIKKMPNVYAVNLLETKTDIPDDVFKTLIVVTFDSGKKEKDVREEIDYRELV